MVIYMNEQAREHHENQKIEARAQKIGNAIDMAAIIACTFVSAVAICIIVGLTLF